MLGRLNGLSLAYATILLGLADGYGVILYQERIADPSRSWVSHRREVAPSLVWACVTTALAFAMLVRSSLPGLAQLGLLVALGMVVAAVIMLAFYLGPLERTSAARPGRATIATTASDVPRAADGRGRARLAWTGTIVAAAAGVAVILAAPPPIDATTERLGPRESSARRAMLELQREILGEREPVWLLARGTDEADVAAKLARASERLDAAVAAGVLEAAQLPDAVWPHPEMQRANRERAAWLARRLDAARAAALEAGFTEEALALTEHTLAAFGALAEAEPPSWPARPAARWLVDQFASRADGELVALGQIDPAADTDAEALLALDAQLAAADAGRLFGWPLLSRSLATLMRQDLVRVLVPTLVVLLLALAAAFRRPAEIALSFATLGFTLLCLVALTSLLDWSWNLMNVMALPLLCGAGVDYSIHVQLGMRRHGGDAVEMRRSVGRAILLSGATTIVGFGSLASASNAGLASLGRVAAMGMSLALFTSLVLLPSWWQVLAQRGVSR
jgi:predicted RND superfamily exporter protein